jgi:hypothetical protein
MRRALFPRLVATALVASATLALAALTAPEARAQPVDLETKSAARKLGTEGQKLFEAGNVAGALEKFNLADSLVPAPTLGLRAARCLSLLGRLVEASERYLDVTRMQLDRNAPAVMRKAQAEALAERDKLLPTIPSLDVTIEGPTGAGITVIIDAKAVPPALLGQKRPVDPGTHRVEAKRADTTVAREVTLKLAEAGEVTLKLPPLPAKPKPPDTFPYRTVGFIGVGVGVAGLLFGGINGLLALTTEQKLVIRCGTDRLCPPAAWPQSDAFDLMRTFTTAGFIIGASGLAVGIPFLLAAPGPPKPATTEAPPTARIDPWIGLGAAGVRGTF